MHVFSASHSNNLHLNVHPYNQLYTEKWGGYYASFAAMLHLLHSITYKYVISFSAMNPVITENADEKQHIMSSQISTLHFPWKELGHKGGQKISVLYVPWLVKRHVLGISWDKQMSNSENQAHSLTHCWVMFAKGICIS